jgi:Tol biopolymer transport system component
MTAESRFDRQLPAILEDLYVGPSPDYRDEVLAAATRTGQRPAWAFPGRWIPMADFAGRLSAPVRFPFRTVAVALVIIALILAGALIYTGSRPRLPAPFGPAANGLVAYTQGVDIYTYDPRTAQSRVLVKGAAQYGFGRYGFSPDGTKIAYLRGAILGYVPGEGSHVAQDLAIVNADGSGLKQLTPEPLIDSNIVAWSPDGRVIAIDNVVDGKWRISLINTDGSGMKTLAVGMEADSPAWRPPDGNELAFRAAAADGTVHLFAARPDGTGLRVLAGAGTTPATEDWKLGRPVWSPDGSRLAYHAWVDLGHVGSGFRIHVIDAAGFADRSLAAFAAMSDETDPLWSPDGQSLVIMRWGAPEGSGRVAIVPADGHDTGRALGPDLTNGPDGAWQVSWAPDGSQLLAFSNKTLELRSIDPATGNTTTPTWSTTNLPDWQRAAPDHRP